MKRLIGILGGIASLYAIAWLLFDDGMSSTDVARFGVAAIAGAVLAHGVRRGGYPWQKHAYDKHSSSWADVAKHAIDADAKAKRGEA